MQYKDLTKDQKFFIKNIEKFAEHLNSIGDKELYNLLKNQKNNLDTLLNEVAKVVLKYKVSNEYLSISTTEQLKVYSNLSKIIDELIEQEKRLEKNALGDLLVSIGNDKYYSNTFLLSLGTKTDIKKVNKTVLNKIINKTINGKNYSDRYGINKSNVAKSLKYEVKQLLNGNSSINLIQDTLKKRYNVNAAWSKRLISNEISRVQIEVNEQWQKDNDIEWVMWSATLDEKTSLICQELDTKTWNTKESYPKPIENSHVGCRCCLISLPSADYKPSSRLNNITKENVEWQDYKNWYANYKDNE